jgi:hypothetical protein
LSFISLVFILWEEEKRVRDEARGKERVVGEFTGPSPLLLRLVWGVCGSPEVLQAGWESCSRKE